MPRKEKEDYTIKYSGGKFEPRPNFHVRSSQLHIAGVPVFSAEFHKVPSRNARKGWRGQMGVNKEWRFEAMEKALNYRGLEWNQGFEAQCDPLIKHRALVVVRVFLRNQGVADIHNPDIKPMLDGFTDGGVWPDDEWAWNPVVVFAWAGISDTKDNKIIIDVYELHSLYIAGEEQPLPEGRVYV